MQGAHCAFANLLAPSGFPTTITVPSKRRAILAKLAFLFRLLWKCIRTAAGPSPIYIDCASRPFFEKILQVSCIDDQLFCLFTLLFLQHETDSRARPVCIIHSHTWRILLFWQDKTFVWTCKGNRKSIWSVNQVALYLCYEVSEIWF